MKKENADLIFLTKDLIQRWKKKGSNFDYFRVPLENFLMEMESGDFFQRNAEDQKATILGINGQYLGKGEVLRVLIPEYSEHVEYLKIFRQIIDDYVKNTEFK